MKLKRMFWTFLNMERVSPHFPYFEGKTSPTRSDCLICINREGIEVSIFQLQTSSKRLSAIRHSTAITVLLACLPENFTQEFVIATNLTPDHSGSAV
jgi:hypothetical protein